jgi:hypothetical protein
MEGELEAKGELAPPRRGEKAGFAALSGEVA